MHRLCRGAVLGTLGRGQRSRRLVVAPDKLIEFLTHLRDQEGYDLLSNLTCVDYSAYKGKARGGSQRAL